MRNAAGFLPNDRATHYRGANGAKQPFRCDYIGRHEMVAATVPAPGGRCFLFGAYDAYAANAVACPIFGLGASGLFARE